MKILRLTRKDSWRLACKTIHPDSKSALPALGKATQSYHLQPHVVRDTSTGRRIKTGTSSVTSRRDNEADPGFVCYPYVDFLNPARELKQRMDEKTMLNKVRSRGFFTGAGGKVWIDFSQPGEKERLRSAKDLRFI